MTPTPHTTPQRRPAAAGAMSAAVRRLGRIRALLTRPVPAAVQPPVWQLIGDRQRPPGLHPDTRVRILVVSGLDYHGHYVTGRAGDLDWSDAYAWIRSPLLDEELRHD